MSAPAVHLVVPGPLDQRTGGYVYDRRIVHGLRARGREVVVHELTGAHPRADEAARRAAARCLDDIPPGALPVIDGLALPAFAGVIEEQSSPWVALIHHPLALETGLPVDDAEALAALEGRLLAGAARVIVTSPATRHDVAALGVAPQRIGVVLPGTDPAPLARGSGGPGASLLCIASLTPRKGHLVLLEALARLPDLDWRLTLVGSLERDPGCARAVLAARERLGLVRQVEVVGEHDEAALAAFYGRADLFVLASFHEGYGMVLADALARGLPVIASRAGAIPDTVPEAAGLLVPPGDAGALAGALRRVIGDPELRRRLAQGATQARQHLPSWKEAARRFAGELDRLCP